MEPKVEPVTLPPPARDNEPADETWKIELTWRCILGDSCLGDPHTDRVLRRENFRQRRDVMEVPAQAPSLRSSCITKGNLLGHRQYRRAMDAARQKSAAD